MSDPVTDANNINTTAATPATAASDGQSASAFPIESQIAAAKFAASNNFLSNLGTRAKGQPLFPGIKIAPPGARGGCDDDCY